MKQLTCAMCGSSNLIKQDDLFICQNCGTKYTVEEARKIMIDGPVDVSGSTVKISNSEKLNNLYQVARRFRDDNNAENAEKYYQMILVEDPNSWEASFYVVYFDAMRCKIAEIASAANSVRNCLQSVFSLIKSDCPSQNQNSAIEEIVNRCIIVSKFLFTGATNRYYEIDKRNSSLSALQEYDKEYKTRMTSSRDIMYVCGNTIDSVLGNNNEIWKNTVSAWNSGIELHKTFISESKKMYKFFDDKEDLAIIDSYTKKIAKYDKNLDLQLKIDILEKEVNQLQKEYDKMLVPYNDGKGGAFIFGFLLGAVFSVEGGFLLFYEYSNSIERILGFVLFCLGVICLISAFKTLVQKDNPTEREENRQRIEPKLREKQAMLEELKNKRRSFRDN